MDLHHDTQVQHFRDQCFALAVCEALLQHPTAMNDLRIKYRDLANHELSSVDVYSSMAASAEGFRGRLMNAEVFPQVTTPSTWT